MRICPSCVTGTITNDLPRDRPAWWRCGSCSWQGSQGQLDALAAQPTSDQARATLRDEQLDRARSGVPLPRIEGRLSHRQPTTHLVCPGCWVHACVVEMVPPSPGRLAFYGCTVCEWQGTSAAFQPDHSHAAPSAMVRQCRSEDRRRGKKGGGSRNARSRKDSKQSSNKTCVHRPDREEVSSSKVQAAAPKERVVKVPGLDIPAQDLRAAVADYVTSELPIDAHHA